MKSKNNFSRLVNAAAVGGHYIWREQDNIEEFSPNLISMLRFDYKSKNFAAMAAMFGDKEQQLLQQVADLKSGKKDSFVMDVEVNLQDNIKEMQCIGCAIVSENSYNIAGIVLWFYDVSEYLDQINNLTWQNSQINAELKEYISIFNTLPIPIWKRDSDYKIRYCNVIYSKYVDGESENINNAEIPELDQSLNSLSMLARENGRPLRMKKHLVIKGERRFFSITEISIKTSGEVLGFAYDITDQDEIEKELARHISAHRDLLESSSSAMVVYGPDTKLRFYNNSFVNLWGLRSSWLDTNPTYGEILEVLREKRKLPEQADFKQFRREQMMLFQDITRPQDDLIHLPDGKAIRTIAIPHALGGILFSYEDVTDKLAMERSFNTLIAVQRETLDNLSEAVALFGEDGKIRLYNPVFIKMWQQEEDYLEKQPRLTDLLERSKDLYSYHGKWEDFKKKIISRILKRKYSVQRDKLTNNRTIDMITRPLPNGDTLVSYVDVTDSIVAEKNLIERNLALEEADRLKTEFLANISYELRTPLTSIIGFAEALEAEYFGKLNSQQRDYTSGINTASSDLLALINDILDLASIEAGYMVLELRKFDVYKALDSVTKLVAERCRKNKQSIILKCDKKIGKIIADEVRIKHVILKLLSNAMKFTKAGGSIILGAIDAGDSIKIWVEDTGIGIEDKDKKKVFERFFKTKSAQQMKKSGAGLGLAVVKNIVELHNGTVNLLSEPEKFTKITITLKKNNV